MIVVIITIIEITVIVIAITKINVIKKTCVNISFENYLSIANTSSFREN